MLTYFKLMVSYDQFAQLWQGAVVARVHGGTQDLVWLSGGIGPDPRNDCFEALLQSVARSSLYTEFRPGEWNLLVSEIERNKTAYGHHSWFSAEVSFGSLLGGILTINPDGSPLHQPGKGIDINDSIWDIAKLSHPQPWTHRYTFVPSKSVAKVDPDLLDMVPF